MIRKLADRLAQVDLLGRAAELLQRQIDFKLEEGAAESRARLATIRVLNKEPELALDALQKQCSWLVAPVGGGKAEIASPRVN